MLGSMAAKTIDVRPTQVQGCHVFATYPFAARKKDSRRVALSPYLFRTLAKLIWLKRSSPGRTRTYDKAVNSCLLYEMHYSNERRNNTALLVFICRYH